MDTPEPHPALPGSEPLGTPEPPQPTLPGLEPPTRPPSYLEAAVRETLEALARVAPEDAARNALAVAIARIIEDKLIRGRTSTVANDARVLMELLDRVDPGDAGGVNEALRKAMLEWSAEVNRDSASDAGAEVRDPAES